MFVSLVLGLGLEHSCPWPREYLSSERLSLALASDFFCVLGLGLEPCVLDSTSANEDENRKTLKTASLNSRFTVLENNSVLLTCSLLKKICNLMLLLAHKLTHQQPQGRFTSFKKIVQ